MNFRLAISDFPGAEVPARARLLAALAEATGLAVDELEGRLTGSPAWLLEVPDRYEAEQWRDMLNRLPGVSAALVPALGPNVPSMADALPRARDALSRAVRRPRGVRDSTTAAVSADSVTGASLSARGSGDHRPAATLRARGSSPGRRDAPSGGAGGMFITGDQLRRLPSGIASAGASSPPTASSRGITGPISGPDTEPDFVRGIAQDPTDMSAARDETGPLELVTNRPTRRGLSQSPGYAAPAPRRRGVQVKASVGQRLLGPIVRVGGPIALIVGAVLLWRYLTRVEPVPPPPNPAQVVEEGQAPRAVLRYAPSEEEEAITARLALEHRFATRQVTARPRIDTIGGQARLEILDQTPAIVDIEIRGREGALGPVSLLPYVRAALTGQTGPQPPPAIPDLDESDRGRMRLFARMLRPPYVIMPEAPVGLGASWRYRYEAADSPFGMPADIQVQMKGRDGDRVELAITAKLSAPPDLDGGAASSQRIGAFDVRFDPPVRIFDLNGVGTGRATIDLARMVPISIDIAVQFAARVEARTGLGTQLIDYSPILTLKLGDE